MRAYTDLPKPGNCRFRRCPVNLDRRSFVAWLVENAPRFGRDAYDLAGAVVPDPEFAGRDPEMGYHGCIGYMRRRGYREAHIKIAERLFPRFIFESAMNELLAN